MISRKLNSNEPKAWLQSRLVPSDLKIQLKKMSEKEIHQAFARHPLAFGTAGIRAKMGPGPQYLNTFVYQQMTIGYCKYILSRKYKNPSILIVHDNRLNSDTFALSCADVVRRMGISVYLMENNKLLPTPIASYAIRKYKLHGGINITASHNPKEDNGFKAYNALGAQVLPNEAQVIVKNMPSSSELFNLDAYCSKKPTKINYIKYDQLVDSFFKEIIDKTIIDRQFLLPKIPIKKLPIVFTGFHGTTTHLMPKLLRKIGFKKVYVYPKHANISGKFENCPISNPEDDRAFKDVTRYALKVKATIIIGCDPDGDRMSIGFKKTNRWRFLSGNEMGGIFAHYKLNRKQYDKIPLIITTHVSTSYIDRIAAKYNAKVLRTKTGFKWMSNMIDSLPKKYQFILGFEEAIGALVHTVCRDKDSFGATILALEALNKGNPYFTDLHDYYHDRMFDIYGPSFARTYSYNIISNNWKKDAKIMMDRALHANPKDYKLYDYSIKKIYYHKQSDCVVWQLDNESWFKFRISGTEPKFKIYFNLLNEMAGQLVAAANMNISIIEKTILKGIKFTK